MSAKYHIFCFHRVSDEYSPAYPPIPVKVFDRICRFIKRNYNIIDIEDSENAKTNKKPSAIITFDDAYMDFYENALPILFKYKIPAIQHIITHSAETGETFWTQKLNKIVKKYSDVRIKNVPYAGFKQNLYYKFIKGIKTYYPLNYIDFNKDKARSFLMEEYGWENYGGKHHESSITAFLHSYIMPTKYNMDYRCATFSSQIVSGQISREEALRELERPPYDEAKIANDKMFVAQKLGISTEELDSFLKLPPKTYINFPNSKKQIEWFYAVYRRFLG